MVVDRLRSSGVPRARRGHQVRQSLGSPGLGLELWCARRKQGMESA